jgi:hypothetical protein
MYVILSKNNNFGTLKNLVSWMVRPSRSGALIFWVYMKDETPTTHTTLHQKMFIEIVLHEHLDIK